MNPYHPMQQMGYVPNQQLGFDWFDFLKESGQDLLDSWKEDVTGVVGEDVIALTDKLAQEAYEKELAKQKQNLTEQLAKELQNITNGGSSGSDSGGGSVMDQITGTTKEIAASVPGGMPVLLGSAAVIIFLLMRR